jgi:manganese oxidase
MSDSRRSFLKKSGLLGAGMLTGSGIVSAQHQGHTHPPPQTPAKKETPKKTVAAPSAIVPVETPDVPKLPWTLDNGVKVFQLSAEVVKTQLLPGMREMIGWGYNGSVPGPTIEVNEGDRVRIMFHNKLPESTTIIGTGSKCHLKWMAHRSSASRRSNPEAPLLTSSHFIRTARSFITRTRRCSR